MFFPDQSHIYFSDAIFLAVFDFAFLLACLARKSWQGHGSDFISSFHAMLCYAKSLQSCPTLCDPLEWQPTRLPRPWDSPGKNTGVGCHFLLQCMKVKSESEVAQSCPTLSDPMDCSPPGSSIHGIFQARVLEWGAIAFSMVRMAIFTKSTNNKCWRGCGGKGNPPKLLMSA